MKIYLILLLSQVATAVNNSPGELIDSLRIAINGAIGGRPRQEIVVKHWKTFFEKELDALGMIVDSGYNSSCITVVYPKDGVKGGDLESCSIEYRQQ